jgi:hypothetical protein
MAYENQLEWIVGGKFGIYIKLFFRVLQFVLGLTIAGIYGSDLAAGAKNGAGWNANWGYAAVVGGLTAVTAAVYLVPKIKSYAFFAVDLFYVILFSAVIGIFGKAYFNRAIPIGNTGAVTVKGPNRQRMVIAAWIDVITGILWALTGISSTILWFRVRRERMKMQQYA